jgi:hypothetical protein
MNVSGARVIGPRVGSGHAGPRRDRHRSLSASTTSGQPWLSVYSAVRFVLKSSPSCEIPEIVFQRPGEAL